jgi:hypothetical protein
MMQMKEQDSKSEQESPANRDGPASLRAPEVENQYRCTPRYPAAFYQRPERNGSGGECVEAECAQGTAHPPL